MPAIQIKNVPSRIYKRLKESSRRNHRSVSGEVLYLLEKSLFQQEPGALSLLNNIETTRRQIETRFGVHPSSVGLIREDRDQ